MRSLSQDQGGHSKAFQKAFCSWESVAAHALLVYQGSEVSTCFVRPQEAGTVLQDVPCLSSSRDGQVLVSPVQLVLGIPGRLTSQGYAQSHSSVTIQQSPIVNVTALRMSWMV